ncbi:hypothetical protein MRY87_11755 [bacterium]|nr:hypothetical protein [bacterium]
MDNENREIPLSETGFAISDTQALGLIRKLLLGGELKQMEHRLQSIEEAVDAKLSRLEKDILKSLEMLDEELQDRLQNLQAALSREADSRAESFAFVGKILSEAASTVERKFESVRKNSSEEASAAPPHPKAASNRAPASNFHIEKIPVPRKKIAPENFLSKE